jgi:hypothetical protein
MRPVERLLSLAHEVAAACPPELGGEIAVMGSAGAGLADEYSDLELLLLVDDTPTPEEARAWLESVGATEVLVGPDDSGVWGWCRIDGVEVEPYWHAASEAERDVEAIARGEVIEHERLAVAHVFTHMRPIRSSGLLARLEQRLARYPDDLALRLVHDAARGWEVPSPRLGGAIRGDRLALESFLLHEAEHVLRVVFALNRRWEPPRWKWLAHFAATLPVAPPALAERVVAPLVDPDAVAAVLAMTELANEALALVPPTFDVAAARRGVESRLAELAPLRREGATPR